MQDILSLNLTTLVDKLNAGELTSVEATRAALKRIKQTERLNAFITVDEENALKAAAAADEKRGSGGRGSLLGVPIAVKDNISTKGLRTTCASKTLENYVPPFDAFVMTKLREAGAVIVGKTNMDEFAMGSTNETSYFGKVLNPLDENRVSGGSSGGSAACVAAGQVFGALGSDTGGSIRQPAAYCGVVGLKPTYSAVSRNGVVAFASSLDQVGTVTRSVQDGALMLSVIAGQDKGDSTSTDFRFSMPAPLKNLKGKKIGVIKEYFDSGMAAGVRSSVENAIADLKSLGAEIKEVSIGSFPASLAAYYILSCAEAATNLARFDGIKYGYKAKDAAQLSDIYYNSRSEGFGAEVKRRIMTGNYVLSSGYYDAYYLKALKLRTLIKRDFDAAFCSCDLLVGPTAPTVAPKFDRSATGTTEAYLSDIYTVPVNIAGLPALSLPCGAAEDGMPAGLQFIGNAFSEELLLSVAASYESHREGR